MPPATGHRPFENLDDDEKLDALTKAVLQAMAADISDDLSIKVILYGQSIDNVLSALSRKSTRDHRVKVQQFKERFPDYAKVEDLDKAKDLWMNRRYGSSDQPGSDFGIQALCTDLLNFAVKTMAAERSCLQTVLWAEVATRAELIYSHSIRQWKPDTIPGYVDFDAFRFIGKIREDCRRRDLAREYELGTTSGLIYVQLFGLPEISTMTELEHARLSNTFGKFRRDFDELVGLRDRIEYRNVTGHEVRSEGDLSMWVLKRDLAADVDSAKDENIHRIGLVITPSPRAMGSFAGRIENLLYDFWGDFPLDKVRELLEDEALGKENLVCLQKCDGVAAPFLGLRDVARFYVRRELTAEELDRLRGWDWFVARAGTDGSERLKRFIDEARRGF